MNRRVGYQSFGDKPKMVLGHKRQFGLGAHTTQPLFFFYGRKRCQQTGSRSASGSEERWLQRLD